MKCMLSNAARKRSPLAKGKRANRKGMVFLKKLVAFFTALFLLFSATAALAASAPNNTPYKVLEDFSNASTADLGKEDGLTSALADLSTYSLASGTQAISGGKLVYTTTAGSQNCTQGKLFSALNDGNRSDWKASEGFRFYVEVATDIDVSMTLYLRFNESLVPYDVYMNGTGVSFINAAGTAVTPTYYDAMNGGGRYYFLPKDFTGWVLVPNTFAPNATDTAFGWRQNPWAADIDYSKVKIEEALSLEIDIRWEAAQGSMAIDDLQLYGAAFKKNDEPGKTGDALSLAYLFTALAGGGALVVMKKRKA